MSQLNDLQYSTLIAQGYTGALPDMFSNWYSDNKEYIIAFSDNLVDVMSDMGYTGSFNDMSINFWTDGGYLTAFRADLTNSIVPFQGTFSSFSGDDGDATVIDHEGVVRNTKTNEIRYKGARRVENLSTASRMSVGLGIEETGILDPEGGYTAYKVTQSSAFIIVGGNSLVHVSGNDALNSIWLRSDTITSVAIYSGQASTSPTLTITPEWKRYTHGVQTTVGSGKEVGIVQGGLSGTDSIEYWMPQSENVTDQSIQEPAECVSVGIESAPYHGANVDGVKYFTTLNGNTTTGNVVTEATGADITSADLEGVLGEEQSTNYADTSDANTQTVDVSTATGDFTVSTKGTASYTITLGTALGTISDATCTEASPAHLNITTTGTIVLTLDSGAPTQNPDNSYYIQVENLPYPTSFIPSAGAGSVTRTAEALQYEVPASLTGSAVNDFVITGEITPSFNLDALTATKYILDIKANTNAERIAIEITADGKLNAKKTVGSVDYEALGNDALTTAGAPYKFAVRFGQSGVHLFINETKQTDTDANASAIDMSVSQTNMFIGSDTSSSNQSNVPIKNMEEYKGDLSDARCKALTS